MKIMMTRRMMMRRRMMMNNKLQKNRKLACLPKGRVVKGFRKVLAGTLREERQLIQELATRRMKNNEM